MNESASEFAGSSDRLVAVDVNTTYRPSSLMSGSYESPSGSAAPWMRSVVSSSVSRT